MIRIDHYISSICISFTQERQKFSFFLNWLYFQFTKKFQEKKQFSTKKQQKAIKMDYDLLKTQQDYLNHALTYFSGLKALVVDDVTTGIVSHLYSMMDVAQKEIYIITKINDKQREPLYYATAICVLHPSKDIIECLIEELKVPKYKQYFICLLLFEMKI